MNFNKVAGALALAYGLALAPVHAEVIGQMAPPQALTAERLAAHTALSAPERAAWQDYLERSRTLMAADKAALAAELGTTAAPQASTQAAAAGNGMPLKQAAGWYATPAALRVADNIVSYQTPAGGWGKNVNRDAPVRQRGEHYVHGNVKSWTFVGTIDNDATITELRFLARVIANSGAGKADAYRAAFDKGVRYLLAAQYPNGGFPQVYPLEGGYHDAVTFNDNAVANVVDLLEDIAERKGDYSFVAADLATQASAARNRAESVIIAGQIRIDGVLTAWCQQHDALTLAPVGARNFEPIALTSVESARLLNVLMRDPQPTPAMVTAIDAGAAWLKRVAIGDKVWSKGADGYRLTTSAGAGPLWARLYDLQGMRPVFGDRDRTIHTDVNELSAERRNGYAWYVTSPASTLERYARWAARHGKNGKPAG